MRKGGGGADDDGERWARIGAGEMDAWRRLGGAPAVAVLAALRLHADSSDEAWPSLDTLAACSGTGRSTVKRTIARAVDAGLVEVWSKPRGANGRPTNSYRLTPAGPSGTPALHDRGQGEPKPPRPEEVKVHGEPKPDGGAPEPGSVKVHGEPKVATEGGGLGSVWVQGEPLTVNSNNYPSTSTSTPLDVSLRKTPAAGSSSKTDVETVWSHYARCHRDHYASRNGQAPRPPKLNTSRRDLIKTRLRDYPADDLLAAVAGLFGNPFNLGDNDRSQAYLSLELALRINRDGNNLERFRDQHFEAAAKATADRGPLDLAGRSRNGDIAWRGRHGDWHSNGGRIDTFLTEAAGKLVTVPPEELRPLCRACEDAYADEEHDCRPPAPAAASFVPIPPIPAARSHGWHPDPAADFADPPARGHGTHHKGSTPWLREGARRGTEEDARMDQ